MAAAMPVDYALTMRNINSPFTSTNFMRFPKQIPQFSQIFFMDLGVQVNFKYQT